MITQLIEHFSELDDLRYPGKVEHQLIDILVIAICAVLACAESWEDSALYGRSLCKDNSEIYIYKQAIKE